VFNTLCVERGSRTEAYPLSSTLREMCSPPFKHDAINTIVCDLA
jgi:hypothetical protein